MVIEAHIWMITLNVNGLNTPSKRHRLTGQMNTCEGIQFQLPQ